MAGHDVAVGQIYGEKDPRFPTRRIRVDLIRGAVVSCTSWYVDSERSPRRSRISLYRLCSDYVLLEEE